MRWLAQRAGELRPIRAMVGAALLCRGFLLMALGRSYAAVNDICRAYRISNVAAFRSLAGRFVFRVIDEVKRSGRNSLIESYLDSGASHRCAELYTVVGGAHELFRDLIVLKRWRSGEKGVILLKYARTFDAVVALFDLERLLARYMFVLEPCWAGYCDPSLLMFVQPGHPVLVQCFTGDDEQFVRDVGAPLVPVRLGPADWVDADLFTSSSKTSKLYDLVMVANWAPHKRHGLLFSALREIRERRIRVLLIGFPWAGRTGADVRREADAIGNAQVEVEVLEALPASEVARHVSRCKAFVFLSRKEGDNKALVEALFAGVPAIVYKHTIGGASGRINAQTGIFSSDEELPNAIRYMLDHWQQFSPRAWALEHSGSVNATRVLNEALRNTFAALGMPFTDDVVEKTNSPNLAYKDSSLRARFQADYDYILECRRARYQRRQDAVA